MPEPGDESVRDAREAVGHEAMVDIAFENLRLRWRPAPKMNRAEWRALFSEPEAAIRASERAEQQGREWEIAEAEFQRGYAAGRASERERYAALVRIIKMQHDIGPSHHFNGTVTIPMSECSNALCKAAALAALEEAESA